MVCRAASAVGEVSALAVETKRGGRRGWVKVGDPQGVNAIILLHVIDDNLPEPSPQSQTLGVGEKFSAACVLCYMETQFRYNFATEDAWTALPIPATYSQ